MSTHIESKLEDISSVVLMPGDLRDVNILLESF